MKPSFVVDSSVALAWCFLDEATPATKKLLSEMDDSAAVVPAWWYIELTNVLALSERKGRIDPARLSEFIALIEGLDIELDMQAP